VVYVNIVYNEDVSAIYSATIGRLTTTATNPDRFIGADP
jgi:hypothetical protein